MTEWPRQPEQFSERVGETENDIEWTVLKNPEYRQWLRDRMRRCITEIQRIQPETIVFLDKSARPLAWLLSGMWPKGVQKPNIRFLNIGYPGVHPTADNLAYREKLFDFLLAEETRSPQLAKLFQKREKYSYSPRFVSGNEFVPGLPKPLFASGHASIVGRNDADSAFDGRVQSVRAAFRDCIHAGKSVVIFDENFASGMSVVYAADQLLKAFPGSKPFGLYFSKYGEQGPRSGKSEFAGTELPWIREPWTGVYEWPTDDGAFTFAPTDNNRALIETATKKAVDRFIGDKLAGCVRLRDGVKAYLEHLQSEDASNAIEQKQQTNLIKKVRLVLAWLQKLTSQSFEKNDVNWTQVLLVKNFLKDHPDAYSGSGDLEDLSDAIDSLTYIRGAGLKFLQELPSPEEMIHLADQLRAEIKAVAKGI